MIKTQLDDKTKKNVNQIFNKHKTEITKWNQKMKTKSGVGSHEKY